MTATTILLTEINKIQHIEHVLLLLGGILATIVGVVAMRMTTTSTRKNC